MTQWDIPGPNDLCIRDGIAYVAEGGQWVSLRTLDGQVVARLGGDESILMSGHGITVDADGSIYVTEIIRNQRVTKLQRL